MTRQNIIAMAKFELGASLLNCGALVTMHTKDDVTKKSQRGAGAYPWHCIDLKFCFLEENLNATPDYVGRDIYVITL